MNNSNKILAILIIGCCSCNEEQKSVPEHEANAQTASSKPCVLDREIFTKDFLTSKIHEGMALQEVESILGPPHKYRKFMDTVRAEYFLSEPESKGLNFVGFSVVYKDGKVHTIDEEWLGKK